MLCNCGGRQPVPRGPNFICKTCGDWIPRAEAIKQIQEMRSIANHFKHDYYREGEEEDVRDNV